MKTSFKSKLFLLSYGIILSFIVGLIILNNSFLNTYYIHVRENSLIEGFEEVKDVSLDSANLDTTLSNVESKHNINTQILVQLKSINPSDQSQEFLPDPTLYVRLYGSTNSIYSGIITQIIYEFNKQYVLRETPSFGKEVNLNDSNYLAYLTTIPSNPNNNSDNFERLALCVSTQSSGGNYVYYIFTVTIQSIQDSVQIFNSFTILVGFIFMIISGLVMYLLSYRLTNPILEMNTVAQEISNLDFSKKVHVTSDDEIGTLGVSINKMSTQLEEFIGELQLANDKLGKEILYKTNVDKMRREFIASASHELKTPLSLIMGYAEALRLPDLDLATKEDYLNIILDESGKMNKLVMDLLKLSQLENRSVDFELKEVNLKDLISDTVKLFSIIFKEKDIEIKKELIDVVVKSDYEQLQTVLTNFINNALNHLDDKKEITIKTEKIENNQVRLSVYNSGPSIDEDEKSNIWESFYKVDKARTRAYGGQGLGLSICKNILDSLGYDFGVENVENGVVFYFDIYSEEI